MIDAPFFNKLNLERTLTQWAVRVAREHNALAKGYVAAAQTGTVAPTTGSPAAGDEVRNSAPANGLYQKWVYIGSYWVGVGQIGAKKDTTANRPTKATLGLADDLGWAGYLYLDTTLDVDGKPIWWTGTAWVDATGAVV